MFWSTCGYLIDRQVMRPIIDQLVFEKDGWLQFKVRSSKYALVVEMGI